MSQAPDRAEKQKQNDAAGAPLEGVEKAKKIAAYQAVDDYFRKDFTYVGIGSGSTILYVIQAIQKALGDQSTGRRCLFVPTGYQSRAVCDQHNLQTVAFDSLSEDQMLDVAFDGADEVDEEFNLIKGGGACLFQEKLVASRAKKFVVVAGQCFATPGTRRILMRRRLSQECPTAADDLGLYPCRGRAHRSEICDQSASCFGFA